MWGFGQFTLQKWTHSIYTRPTTKISKSSDATCLAGLPRALGERERRDRVKGRQRNHENVADISNSNVQKW